MKRGVLTLAVALLTTACTRAETTALYFSEQAPEGETFATRMLVTDRYLRIDYGVDSDDFILFDRKLPTIFSVNHNDKTIMVIKPAPIRLEKPARFEHRTEKTNDTPPAVGGKPVTHYRLSTNGELCFDVFAAKDLLPTAVAALREYHLSIAGEHAAAMTDAPPEAKTDCDLANFVFAPTRYLEHGFPIRQQDLGGNVRQLVDFKQNLKIDDKLFNLPAGYRQYSPAELRGEPAAAAPTAS